MNWKTMEKEVRPEDFGATGEATRAITLTHVCVEGDSASLCGKAHVLDFWTECDEHPEDAAGLDSCSVCWSVYERENRAEAGRDPIPSQRLNWTRGGRS